MTGEQQRQQHQQQGSGSSSQAHGWDQAQGQGITTTKAVHQDEISDTGTFPSTNRPMVHAPTAPTASAPADLVRYPEPSAANLNAAVLRQALEMVGREARERCVGASKQVCIDNRFITP